jgi:HAD superfamily hydrolase (TIGR01509 family)
VTSVFFDIDGTLDDSNDAHARSWIDTFAERRISVAFERVRPLIGMGSDKLLRALDLGIETDGDAGKALTARRKAIFLERYVSDVKAFPGARQLVATIKDAGLRCVVASSASPEELTPLLAIAGATELFDHAIRPDEVSATKPDPDVVLAALTWSRSDPAKAVMIGDTVYDIDAAHRSGVRCIALRCGGSSSDDLAHADAQFDDPAALVAALRRSSLDELLVPSAAAKT